MRAHRTPTPADPPPSPPAPSWRFVDRFGTEWRVYDRVRWAPTPTRAEFRFVPPGHRDARSRLFVRADRVVFELRLAGPALGGWSPADLTDRTLGRQLHAARRAGPLYIPASAGTTLALETERLARDYGRDYGRDDGSDDGRGAGGGRMTHAAPAGASDSPVRTTAVTPRAPTRR